MKKNCSFCNQLKQADKERKDINMFYVENGKILIENQAIPLDAKIKGLPALIDYGTNLVIIGEKYILNYLKTGEVNAVA